LKLSAFGPDDSRDFAVAAVDAAGNEGPRTVALAGVPDLVGLRLSEASAALQARGLVIGKQTLSAPGNATLVVAQRPAAATLAPLQSTVFVTLADDASDSHTSVAANAPLTVHIVGARTVSCTQSRRLTLQIRLDRRAKVAVRFLTTGGVPLDSARLVAVHAGSQTLSLRLPTGLSARKSFRVIVTARTGGRIVRAEIKLTIVQPRIRTKASSSTCG
jgi:PASTA domain